MNRGYLGLRVVALVGTLAAVSLTTACNGSSGSITGQPPPPTPPPPQSSPAPAGQAIFRFDTFGDEALWTDVLQMNQVIETSVDPLTAASVGIKIDADALPPDVVSGIEDGSIALDDPQTTLALIQLNAVVGIQGDVEPDPSNPDKLTLKSVGITCAVCHSTVSDDVHVIAHTQRHGDVDLTGIVGHRLDGWPNRDLNPGAIIALSPAVPADQKAVFNSWGPGKYDARFNQFLGTTDPLTGQTRGLSLFEVSDASTSPDGTGTTYDPFAVLIPPAYGLEGIDKEIYTGDGDLAHEPVGPLAYWNRYVAVTQMGGIGTFDDPRLDELGMSPVDHIHDPDYNIHNLPDQVSSQLADLQAYQFSIPAPQPPDGSFDPAAADRGEQIFAMSCASCHTGALLTDANEMLHPRPASVARDTSYVLLSATQEWRTSPLHGIWQHPPYFHDGSGQFISQTGQCADGSAIGSLAGTDTVTEDLACAVNLYDAKLQLGLTDDERADLVAYLKSL